VLLVAPGHPLAGCTSVCQEDLADWDLVMCPATFPQAFYDVLIPPRTPSGRLTRRVYPVRTTQEIVTLVALGRVVHPTGASVLMYQRDDIVQVPDTEVAAAMRLIFATTHNVAEGAGAASCAAALQRSSAIAGKRIGLLLSGGNVDTDVFARVLGGSI